MRDFSIVKLASLVKMAHAIDDICGAFFARFIADYAAKVFVKSVGDIRVCLEKMYKSVAKIRIAKCDDFCVMAQKLIEDRIFAQNFNPNIHKSIAQSPPECKRKNGAMRAPHMGHLQKRIAKHAHARAGM